MFTAEQNLGDQLPENLSQLDYGIHVAVRTRTTGDYPIIFSNYPSKSIYTNLKLWERFFFCNTS
jgi:hypothetical protein